MNGNEDFINVGGPNHLLSIDQLWVFVSKDEEGNEGVCGFPVPGTAMMPMVAADERRVDSLRGMAKRMAEMTGMRIVLRKFSVCEDVEVFEK